MRRAAVLLLAIAACGGETSRPGKLELVDPGAEPRVQLRYAIGTMERDVAFVAEVQMPHKQTFSDMRYHVRCDGAGRCRYQMVKFEIMGDGSNFESAKQSISGSIAMPPNGLVTITTDGRMTTTPSTPQLFKLAIVPLPAEPVGIGARWKVTEPNEVRTLRLVKQSGKTLTIDSTTIVGNAEVKVEDSGELSVTLDDPFAKGSVALAQTWAANPTAKMDEHVFREVLTLE